MSIADRIDVASVHTLSKDWAVLRKTTFRFRRADGSWQEQTRETYDRGDGAVLLMFDPARRTVMLTRQFRYAAYVNGHDDLMIEAPAGLLDGADAAARVRAEVEEETGYRVRDLRPLFQAYMSPGSVTEKLHFFLGFYSEEDRVGPGGGNHAEGEDIERVEVTLGEALRMIGDGRIRDAKTIMLLQFAALRLSEAA